MKLTKFLSELTNERVRVELKNGTTIQGTLATVSPSMNITLKKASMTIKHRDPVQVSFISIRGSTVRGVVLPDTLNLDVSLHGASVSGSGNGSSGKGIKKRRADGDERKVKRARGL